MLRINVFGTRLLRRTQKRLFDVTHAYLTKSNSNHDTNQ
jgi:hypothetical protein